MRRLRVGLVGIGKIARDQHIPVLRASTQFELVAAASRNARVDGIANYPDLASMLGSRPELDCVAICTPPQAHFGATALALDAGKHVLLEKPPASTTREIALLAAQGRTSRSFRQRVFLCQLLHAALKLMPWPWRKPTDIDGIRAAMGSKLCSKRRQFGAP